MNGPRSVRLAKLAALAGFVTLVLSTYYLRREVLVLSQIRFQADEVRAQHELAEARESYPDRVKQHEIELSNYDIQMKHYRDMMELYASDYEAYVKRIEDKFQPPQAPYPPRKPTAPEVSEKLHSLNVEFRMRKNQYFKVACTMVWISGAAAVALSGSLIFLLMFDTEGTRWHYLAALTLSFVFLIGPAFHSIMTGLIGILQEPSPR